MKPMTTAIASLVLAVFASAALAATNGASPASPPLAAAPQGTPNCPSLLNHTFPRLQDESPQSLCQYSGKVLLVVNTASYCGFTYQYKGLEALHQKYKSKGLVVLGFPSNDFSRKEPEQGHCRLLLQHLWRGVPDVWQVIGARVGRQCPVPATGAVDGSCAIVELQQVPDRSQRQRG